MKSGTNVRSVRDRWILDIYLMLEHRFANILNQVVEFIRILGVVEKNLDISLLSQRG